MCLQSFIVRFVNIRSVIIITSSRIVTSIIIHLHH